METRAKIADSQAKIYSTSLNYRALEFVQPGIGFPKIREWWKHRALLCFWRIGAMDNWRRTRPCPMPGGTKTTSSPRGFPRGTFWGKSRETLDIEKAVSSGSPPIERQDARGWGMAYSSIISPFNNKSAHDLQDEGFWKSLYACIPETVACQKPDRVCMAISLDVCPRQDTNSIPATTTKVSLYSEGKDVSNETWSFICGLHLLQGPERTAKVNEC